MRRAIVSRDLIDRQNHRRTQRAHARRDHPMAHARRQRDDSRDKYIQ